MEDTGCWYKMYYGFAAVTAPVARGRGAGVVRVVDDSEGPNQVEERNLAVM